MREKRREIRVGGGTEFLGQQGRRKNKVFVLKREEVILCVKNERVMIYTKN